MQTWLFSFVVHNSPNDATDFARRNPMLEDFTVYICMASDGQSIE
jgi:hypothetical protein